MVMQRYEPHRPSKPRIDPCSLLTTHHCRLLIVVADLLPKCAELRLVGRFAALDAAGRSKLGLARTLAALDRFLPFAWCAGHPFTPSRAYAFRPLVSHSVPVLAA